MSSVVNELAQVSYIPRYLGLSPLFFKNKKLILSKSLLFISISYHLIVSFSKIYASAALSMKSEEGKLVSVLIDGLETLSAVLVFCSSLYAVCQSKKMNQFIDNLTKVDAYLERYDVRAVFSSSIINIAPLLFALTGFAIRVAINLFLEHAIFLLFHYWIWFNLAFHTHQLKSFLAILNCRMSALLMLLQKSSERKALEDLTKCHNLLCRTAELLGSILSIFFLSVSMIAFFMCVGELYSACRMAFEHHNYALVVVKLMWALYSVSLFFLVVSECAHITHQSKEFNTTFYFILIGDQRNDLLCDKSLSVYIYLKRSVVFTAVGLFNIDYNLVHSVISAALMYLFILIQIGQVTDIDTNNN